MADGPQFERHIFTGDIGAMDLLTIRRALCFHRAMIDAALALRNKTDAETTSYACQIADINGTLRALGLPLENIA